MTEKKTEAPVQEPAPAPEAVGKIWKLQGKFPALADYLVFFGIFLLAQVVGAVTALLGGGASGPIRRCWRAPTKR